MARTSRQTHRQSGFTIVELIVVITVIAILAAITLVSYNGQQDRARTSAIAEGLHQTVNQIGIYYAYNKIFPSSLSDASVDTSGSVSYQYSSTNTTYCITGTDGNLSYWVSETSSTPTKGGCPGHGVNGVPAITNLVTNPSFESSLSGVSGYYGSPLVRATNGGANGSAYVYTTTVSTTQAQGLILTAVPSASPGTTYYCSVAYMGAGTNGQKIIISGRSATSTGGYIGENYSAKQVALSASWQRLSLNFVAPSNASILYVQLVTNGIATGTTIAADGLICTTGQDAGTYYDGNSTNWVWNGAVNASASTGPAS